MTDVLSFADAAGMGAQLLGGKGAGLAAMRAQGLRVPPGFVITTAACNECRRTGAQPRALATDVTAALAALEAERGLALGDPEAPLLLAVRSGAPVSMPGMMDTVLNLGVTDDTVDALARRFGADFAWDCYARFLEGFAKVVLGIDSRLFAGLPTTRGRSRVDALKGIVDEHGCLPADPREQLTMAIGAVLRSWDNPRAVAYRRIEGIDDDLGTAVVVQAMVFGNLNARSGTGVVFTRNPNTGEPIAYGDFLFQAQGEDVVSGEHQTLPVRALAERLPEVWDELTGRLAALEAWRKDMLDVEFTVEDGTLFFLQVRTAKRSALGAVRTALSLARDGTIDRSEALMRVTPSQLESLTRARRHGGADVDRLTTGLAASPGSAGGVICLTPEAVFDAVERGEPAILVRAETSPDDVAAMAVSEGILTARGGLVSHAAVVARGLSVPAVVGADSIRIDIASGQLEISGTALHEGDIITIDGDTGAVIRGDANSEDANSPTEVDELLAWADEIAPSPDDGNAGAPERLAAARSAIERSGLVSANGGTR
jgi:pyruvate, orthophosphate dikinase